MQKKHGQQETSNKNREHATHQMLCMCCSQHTSFCTCVDQDIRNMNLRVGAGLLTVYKWRKKQMADITNTIFVWIIVFICNECIVFH